MKVAAGRIADTFATLAGAETIVLFGSWTARYLGQAGRSPNDIDVLVIGDVGLFGFWRGATEMARLETSVLAT